MSEVLKLTVTAEWFDKIWSQEKIEDFREIKDYWTKRLLNKEYKYVQLINGYGNHRPSMLFYYDGYRTTDSKEKTDLGVGSFYAIKLGEFVESDNINFGLDKPVKCKKNQAFNCDGTIWLENDDLSSYEFSFSALRDLSEIGKLNGKIIKGDKYIKYRSTDCNGDRYIYRAIPIVNEFCQEHDVFDNAC